MPKHLIYLIYTFFFGAILVVLVPRQDIRHLSIYGIIFGGIMDVIILIFGNITGLYGWINYGPFGFMGIPIFFNFMGYILYNVFLFLTEKKTIKLCIHCCWNHFFDSIY